MKESDVVPRGECYGSTMTRADLHRLIDEPFTDDERAAVERARQAFDRGRGIPLEQLMTEFYAAD
ncbi:MAG: hypothetical protein JWM18_799 [Chloroflexi bacterium]|jgi:hypothetical protein|nr:hypothetical protein [Chloroflexota bacterium]